MITSLLRPSGAFVFAHFLLTSAFVVGGSASRPAEDLLGDAFQGLAFGNTVEQVIAGLDGQCDEVRTIAVAKPSLPLARETQTHVIALGVHSVGVDEVAFTFADDALVLVEARGGAVEGLPPALEEVPVTRFGFDVFFEARVVAARDRDAVWLLGPDALHPYLFLWENPDLPSVDPPAKPYERSVERPAMLEFGATLKDLTPRMKNACRVTELENTNVWLPTKPAKQVQVNCYGVAYGGFLRKVEAVFGDDTLQLAWILTGKGEEERLRRALTESFGKPVFVSKEWEFFDGWRVGLRKDKPEILMIADELVPTYREIARATTGGESQ